ncbi:energy-coupling factor ABC transporter ATP-binding protein [Salimicrobium flavidum]|uniref:Energy-coupling factor transport system ATP-binding protein n=1 Tax=Salimicrobium flavidum TaxID=570947 RepID=A0A1N7KI06_9BACI|nr:energy-coupling factor ABC transporter ATP-binding protein [Salimicrobium flavidum]SIS61124.1 energy-coupling factor transport system ATP-binding protein [Salimicrobium flavidum]
MRERIDFSDVTFRYQEDAPPVLKDVDFFIDKGEWVAIIGHNGSGKSTIAKLMNGLLFAESGDVSVDGSVIHTDNVWEIRKKVGMVFQNPDNQFVGTTVRDDIAFGMENHGVPREVMLEKVAEVLRDVQMESYEEHEPHRLSGGQKQRVAIAGVLAVAPDYMVLDEATAMLDPKGRQDILETVREVQEHSDLTLITITHDLREIVAADRVIVMNEGEVWFEGTPREVFAHKDALSTIGLDVPFVAKLTQEMKKHGISFDREPLNHEEMVEELWNLHSTK